MDRYDICFIMVYSRKYNKYTANVLISAIETYAKFVYLHQVDIESNNFLLDLYMLRDKCKKIVVGITFNTAQIDRIIDIVPKIKSILPNALFVAGGPHPSGDPYGTITKLGFDLVVYGEGEETIVSLLNSVYNNNDPRICGTAYLEGQHLILKKRSPINLDSYPPFPFWRNIFSPMEIMRGCSGACYFCQVTYIFGLPRYRSIDNIEYYSKIMFEKGLKDLRFIAPNSFGYGSGNGISPATDQLFHLLARLRVLANRYNGKIFFGTFPSEVRPDSVDDEIVRYIRRFIDNKRIIVGIQSGSNNILSKIHRGYNIEDAINAIESLAKSGFQVDVDLIMGFDFENDEDINSTLNLVFKLLKFDTRIHLHTFIPLPGTPLFSHRSRPLRDDVKKYFMKLIGMGRAYGYWTKQEELAQRIEKYKNMGLVCDMNVYRNMLKITRC